MAKILLVGLGGFAGAVMRYGVGLGMQRAFGDRLPLGTFLVNVVGCLLLGALMAWAESARGLSEEARLVLGVGLLGSFTTFSTFGYETLALVRRGEPALAAGNAVLSLVVGLFAVWVGRGLALRWLAE